LAVVINKNSFNVLEKLSFGPGDWRKHIMLDGRTANGFFNDLKESFGINDVDVQGPPLRFNIPGTSAFGTKLLIS